MRHYKMILGLLALFTWIGSCQTPPEKPSLSVVEALTSAQYEIVDLSYELSSSIPHWPAQVENPFQYDTIARQASGAPSMGAYSTPEHFGTHLDAPIHFADQQDAVHEIEPRQLFGPLVVIDVSAKCASDADYLLGTNDVEAWEQTHGNIPDGAIVIMLTGWGEKWEDYDDYKNQDESGTMHFPGLSPQAAQFLVDNRKINGLGIDTFSVDAGAADGFPVHDIVNGAGIYHLENVANVGQLPASGGYLIVAPIKIKGGSGGQVRIFALVE